MLFHQCSDKVAGTCIFMCYIEFLDVGPDEFDNGFMVSQQVFDEIRAGVTPFELFGQVGEFEKILQRCRCIVAQLTNAFSNRIDNLLGLVVQIFKIYMNRMKVRAFQVPVRI